MKKLVSVFMALAIIFTSAIVEFPLTAVTAQAAASKTQEQAVEWAKAKVGTKAEDTDKAYGPQCVDFILQYYNHLGVSGGGGNANAYAWNALPDGFKRIENYYGFVPEPGDIAVWSKGDSGNSNGHVAVIISADLQTMTVAEIWGSEAGKPNQVVHQRTLAYNGNGRVFWGIIRPLFKNSAVTPTKPIVTSHREYYSTNSTAYVSWNQCDNATSYWLDVWHNGEHIYSNSVGNTTSAVLSLEKKGRYGVFVTADNGSHSITSDCCTFYAKDINLNIWTSNTAMGDYHDAFNVGDYFYLCYELLDMDTGNRIGDYGLSYSVTQIIYNIDGSVANECQHTNDNNWVGLRMDHEGTYHGKITVTGDVNIELSTACTAKATVVTLPTAVTGFTGAATTNSITLRWNKATNATSYKLQQSVNGAWQTIASPTGTTYTVSDLKANTTYNFRIFARSSSGQSAQTKLTVTTPAALPSAVTGFTGAAAADSITLKWNKAVNATSYKLQQQINGAWQTIASPTGNTYIVSGLKANTSYNFRIFARNASGQGAQTKLTVTTSVAVPAAVTGFMGVAAADSITLKWNKAANATSYKLQQQINGVWQTIASPTGNTYVVSGLKSNTSYNFRIFARNSNGQGTQTKLTVKTSVGIPAAVKGFSGTATANSITLKWNKVNGATEYKLQQSVNGAWQTIASPTGTSYTVKGLKSNTSYNFRIFARNSSGQGAQTKLTVKTTVGTPAAVTGFTGTATTNSITLRWDKVSGATEYKLQQMTDGGWETIAMPTETTLTISGLNAKTTYNFRIFARNSDGQGTQTKLTVKTS